MQLPVSTILTQARRIGADIVLSAAAFALVAIVPALNVAKLPDALVGSLLGHMVLYGVISGLALFTFHTNRMIWRYVGFRDSLILIKAATLSVVGFVSIELAFQAIYGIPSPGLLFVLALLIWPVQIGVLAAPRLIVRWVSEIASRRRHSVATERGPLTQVLITGDEERMESFVRDCERSPNPRHRVVGVITDQQQFHGSSFHGVPILGGIGDLRAVTTRLSERGLFPKVLILAKDSMTRADLERYLEQAAAANLTIVRLDQQGGQERSGFKSLDLADLLGRPEIQMDAAAIEAMVKSRCLLVTGAGGSIGSELTRQLASFGPSHLLVTDACEFNLYSIAQELTEKFPSLNFTPVLMDVRDAGLVSSLIEKSKPQLVFHAAALKHVPLLETNPIEAVKTNVLGTVNLADACVRHGVGAMVTISTDKAVNPSNVMGATKRLAEAYCQGMDQVEDRLSPKTRFVTVRFGNVLGSAGSVVPLFQRQIMAGGPVTLTHPEINRFFMTISEAVTLVLQAGAQGVQRDDERGSIYILDMGQPTRIVDLARQMIRLAGFRPDIDIEVKVIGLRPGEKLYEEVMHMDESIIPTQKKFVLKIAPRATDLRIIRQQIHELQQACTQRELERVLRLLQISVPEYVIDARRVG